MRETRSKSSSKEGYIQNYGIKAYLELSEKKAITLDKYIKKYGKELGEIKYSQFTKKRLRQTLKSVPALKIEKELIKTIPDIKSEVLICGHHFDYQLKENILLEIFGDWWHMNPLKYKNNYWNKVLNCYAKDVWSHDNKLIRMGNQKGYRTIVVWEKAINYCFDETINIIKGILKNNIKTNYIINYDNNILIENGEM